MKIDITGLRKYYSDKKILDIDELQIEKGKITGLIGQTGQERLLF